MEEIVQVNRYIDFTLLDPRATNKDIEKLCDIAYKNEYYSVCVNPCYVSLAKGYVESNFNGSLKVVSVVGFPLGASSLNTKLFEAKQAIDDGADEIDFVVNIGRVKSCSYNYIKNEICKMRKVVHKKILKVIIETCYLDENEIIKLCKICSKAKVDFVKTSTGYGTSGADINIVKLMQNELKGICKIKASGGIRCRQDAISFINAGASRIGTSRII